MLLTPPPPPPLATAFLRDTLTTRAQLEFGDKTHLVAMTALRLVARMKRDWIEVPLATATSQPSRAAPPAILG
jgi:hypothetical protein